MPQVISVVIIFLTVKVSCLIQGRAEGVDQTSAPSLALDNEEVKQTFVESDSFSDNVTLNASMLVIIGSAEQHKRQHQVYVTTDGIPPPDNCTGDDEAEINRMLLDTIMPTYKKQILPNNNTKAIQARVEIHINAIPHFSELDSFIELDLFFSELWHDPRLSFGHLPQALCVKNITMGLEYLQRLWTPNVCIVNSKAAVIHSSPSENVFLILYQDGMLWKNCRMLVRGPCEIDLRLFPFDVQTCSLVFESYSFNSQKVNLQWIEGAPISLAQSIELPDFILSGNIANRSVVTYPNGQWDQLKATFVFERRYGFFIMQAFLPTYMTVFVAWINFWMDPKELATRATLAISAFLAMCLQLGNVQQNQPRVSYVKSMDVWMLGSISFLFSALIELAIISYMVRTDKHAHRQNSKIKRLKSIYIPPSPSLGRIYECNEPKVALAQKCASRRPKKARSSIYHETAYGCPIHSCNHEQAPQWSNLVKQWENESDTEQPMLFASPRQPHKCSRFRRLRQRMAASAKSLRGTDKYVSSAEMIHHSRLSVYAVDKFFLIAYPPAYVFFNVVYYIYYLSA